MYKLPAPNTSILIEEKAFRLGCILLIACTWISSALFGMYILAFYCAAIFKHTVPVDWNHTVPGIYTDNSLISVIGIAMHFAMGGILLFLGPIQFISAVRTQYPILHRWCGRLYVLASFCTGLGGLLFVIERGTVGGMPMSIGFGLYGLLVMITSVQTYRTARTQRFDSHRIWAMRLFALVIGSWLYRMDYGFWSMLTDGLGSNNQYNGPFDYIMDFAFYLPNLVVAEIIARSSEMVLGRKTRIVTVFLIGCVTFSVSLGTYYFSAYYWLPLSLRNFK
jgi:hypothetical protein